MKPAPASRLGLTRILLLIWLVLGGLLVAVLCYALSGAFSSPPREPVLVGEVTEYLPESVNLEFVNAQFFDAPMNKTQSTLPLLVVHGVGDEWTVFLARSTRLEEGTLAPRTCVVEWNQSLEMFIELCGGSQWDLSGASVSGPAPRDLDRFPVHVKDGNVYIDLDLIQGPTR